MTSSSKMMRALRNASGISEGLKICCEKNLRTDFAIYSGVGDFANFYDSQKCKSSPDLCCPHRAISFLDKTSSLIEAQRSIHVLFL